MIKNPPIVIVSFFIQISFLGARRAVHCAQSSTEAEYIGMANAAAEVVWLQSLLREFEFSQSSPIVLCDNLSATYLSVNHIHHSYSKHVEIDIHFVRDYVANRVLNVWFVSTKDQLADILTKPLSSLRFSMLKNKLSVLLNPLLLRGVLEISMTKRDSCETCDSCERSPS